MFTVASAAAARSSCVTVATTPTTAVICKPRRANMYVTAQVTMVVILSLEQHRTSKSTLLECQQKHTSSVSQQTGDRFT